MTWESKEVEQQRKERGSCCENSQTKIELEATTWSKKTRPLDYTCTIFLWWFFFGYNSQMRSYLHVDDLGANWGICSWYTSNLAESFSLPTIDHDHTGRSWGWFRIIAPNLAYLHEEKKHFFIWSWGGSRRETMRYIWKSFEALLS